MKSKELKVYNLPKEKNKNTIDAKPIDLFVLIILVGVFFIFSIRNYSFGILLILLSGLILLTTPNYAIIDFFDDYMVLYNKADKSECVIIYYDEITSWHYKRGINYDELVIELEDGHIEKSDAFSKIVFEFYMNMHCRNKKRKRAS